MLRPEDQQKGQIDGDRLLAAADVLLKAEAERPDGASMIDLRVGKKSSAVASGFTCEEMIEAMQFLFRLGMVEPQVRVGKKKEREN